jgi:hypothetical protein
MLIWLANRVASLALVTVGGVLAYIGCNIDGEFLAIYLSGKSKRPRHENREEYSLITEGCGDRLGDKNYKLLESKC